MRNPLTLLLNGEASHDLVVLFLRICLSRTAKPRRVAPVLFPRRTRSSTSKVQCSTSSSCSHCRFIFWQSSTSSTRKAAESPATRGILLSAATGLVGLERGRAGHAPVAAIVSIDSADADRHSPGRSRLLHRWSLPGAG